MKVRHKVTGKVYTINPLFLLECREEDLRGVVWLSGGELDAVPEEEKEQNSLRELIGKDMVSLNVTFK